MEMDLCDGLFSQNGHCGYVLKPAFMRDEGTLFNPSDPSTWQGPGPVTLTIQVWAEEGCWGSCVSVTGALPVPAGQRAILHVPSAQVISGQQLPKVANSKDGAIIDPLVRVEIHGVPADQAHQETKYIENNGEPVVRGPAVPVPALSPTSACSHYKGLTPTGTRPFSSSSTCPSWPLSALWWRIMTRPPGTISWDSSPWPLPTSNLVSDCCSYAGSCWGARLGAREWGGQPQPRCPLCRLPPHPSPLQGWHRHPALFALCPHPHHRAAWPRARLNPRCQRDLDRSHRAGLDLAPCSCGHRADHTTL